jgi:GTP-binding protein
LLGEERSIVSDISGTTRDALDVRCELGGDPYILVDTAGLRHRSKPDTSVEIFSAMRSEEAIRRADAGLLVVDATEGVTAQDKRIAGMLQESYKACIILLNKWDLVSKEDGGRASQGEQSDVIRKNLFFLDYAPVVCISAKTGQGFSRIFTALKSVRQETETRISTGELNRFFRDTFEQHPPPSKSGKRFKLLYATQVLPAVVRPFSPPEFLLFVNDPDLITDAYREYLFNQFRARWPFPGVPIRLRMKGRDSREVQDRKKEGRTIANAAIAAEDADSAREDKENRGTKEKKETQEKSPRRPLLKAVPRPRRAPSHKPQKRLGGKKTAAPRKGRAPRR